MRDKLFGHRRAEREQGRHAQTAVPLAERRSSGGDIRPCAGGPRSP